MPRKDTMSSTHYSWCLHGVSTSTTPASVDYRDGIIKIHFRFQLGLKQIKCTCCGQLFLEVENMKHSLLILNLRKHDASDQKRKGFFPFLQPWLQKDTFCFSPILLFITKNLLEFKNKCVCIKKTVKWYIKSLDQKYLLTLFGHCLEIQMLHTKIFKK